MLQLSFYKALAGILVVVLWNLFLNSGFQHVDHAFTGVGIILICMSWFSYLMLDENSYRNLLENNREKKEAQKQMNKRGPSDMIDYIDTDPESFRDLEKDEKHVAQLASSLGTGIVFFLLGMLLYLIEMIL